MTKQEYLEAGKNVIYLVACAVRSERPDPYKIRAMDLTQVYEVASNHLVLSAVGMALERAGIQNGPFVNAVARAQQKNALLDADRSAVLAKMEEAGIWYMPLKGAVLKNLYPRYGMREMADNDILFDKDRGDDLRRIMVDLGFTVKNFDNGPHDVYYKKPVSNFEMHRTLFSASMKEDLYSYYANVMDRLIPDQGKKYGYHFSDEDFYIYIITHEYKHYSTCGIGIRSLLDTYVYLKRKKLDMKYVFREMGKIGIADFELKNRNLAFRLYNGESLTSEEEEMLNYIIFSEAYGTAENGATNGIKEKGRLGYFLSRLTLPRDVYEGMFPILRKAPFLYPACWVLRLLRGFILHNKTFMAQLEAVLGLNKKNDE